MLRRLALLLLISTFAVPAFAADNGAKPVTKGELNDLIRAYLLEHPEVIVDALEVMQRKEIEKSNQKAQAAVKRNQDEIYDDKMTPAIGDKDAPVTIIEFSDYNCSACKFMFTAMERLMKEQKGRARLLVKELPIFGPSSAELARIGLAVYQLKPDAYFAFHSAMMKAPGRMDTPQLDALLQELKLDPDEVHARAAQDDIEAALDRNQAVSEALGVAGTPTLIVGDEVVPHALDYEALLAKVSQQIDKRNKKR